MASFSTIDTTNILGLLGHSVQGTGLHRNLVLLQSPLSSGLYSKIAVLSSEPRCSSLYLQEHFMLCFLFQCERYEIHFFLKFRWHNQACPDHWIPKNSIDMAGSQIRVRLIFHPLVHICPTKVFNVLAHFCLSSLIRIMSLI